MITELSQTQFNAKFEALSKKEQQQIKGLILLKLKIGYSTLFRKLKKGFEPHELGVISSIFTEFLEPQKS